MALNFSRRQWCTLLIMGLADFCNVSSDEMKKSAPSQGNQLTLNFLYFQAICVSLQAPFFPAEVSQLRTSNESQRPVTLIKELQKILSQPIFCK